MCSSHHSRTLLVPKQKCSFRNLQSTTYRFHECWQTPASPGVWTRAEISKMTGVTRMGKPVRISCPSTNSQCRFPCQKVPFLPVCALYLMPVLLGVARVWSQIHFPEISDGTFFFFCNYNYALWSFKKGISVNYLYAEVLWDCFCKMVDCNLAESAQALEITFSGWNPKPWVHCLISWTSIS